MPKESRVNKRFDRFVRVNEDVQPDQLQLGEMVELDDMVLDNPYLTAKMRGGFIVKNNSQPTGVINKIIDGIIKLYISKIIIFIQLIRRAIPPNIIAKISNIDILNCLFIFFHYVK